MNKEQRERLTYLIRRTNNKAEEAEKASYNARLAAKEAEEIIKEIFTIKF